MDRWEPMVSRLQTFQTIKGKRHFRYKLRSKRKKINGSSIIRCVFFSRFSLRAQTGSGSDHSQSLDLKAKKKPRRRESGCWGWHIRLVGPDVGVSIIHIECRGKGSLVRFKTQRIYQSRPWRKKADGWARLHKHHWIRDPATCQWLPGLTSGPGKHTSDKVVSAVFRHPRCFIVLRFLLRDTSWFFWRSPFKTVSLWAI